MEEKVKVSILLNLYGNLLTENQKRYMQLYYDEDLSLSEIGEIEGITRQAVRTILVKSKNKLFEYENQLKFLDKQHRIKKILDNLNVKNIKETIEKINEQLDF